MSARAPGLSEESSEASHPVASLAHASHHAHTLEHKPAADGSAAHAPGDRAIKSADLKKALESMKGGGATPSPGLSAAAAKASLGHHPDEEGYGSDGSIDSDDSDFMTEEEFYAFCKKAGLSKREIAAFEKIAGLGLEDGLEGDAEKGGLDPETGAPLALASKYLAHARADIRMGFVRKVFGILTFQLAITISIICIFTFVDSVKTFVQDTPAIFYAAWVVTLVLMVALACCVDCRRSYPMNYICLVGFTLCQSYLLGMVASYFDTKSVVLALGMTAAVALGLILLASQSKFDFTSCGAGLFVGAIILVIFGLVNVAIEGMLVDSLYGAFASLLFGLFLVYDVQAIMGGDHKYKLEPDEYIFGALSLYIDIVNLFTVLLVCVLGRGESQS